MYEFVKYLIKKSDISKNEFYNYNPPVNKKDNKKQKFNYEKIEQPIYDNYIIFDFETTGLDPYSSKIIEIGAAKIKNGEINESFNTLVNPETVIPPFIVEKVHITNEMVKNKETINNVLPKFVKFIDNLPLIAHNARFDMSFLLKNAFEQNLTVQNPSLDTLYLSRKYLKTAEKHNLEYLAKHFNIEHKNAHRAYADVLTTFEIYKIILKEYSRLSES